MTVHQHRVFEYLAAHPGALTSEVIAALYPSEPSGDLLVSVCLTALAKQGLIADDNRVLPLRTAEAHPADEGI